MSQTTLTRMLSLFEESTGTLTLHSLAEELEVTTERLEGMVDFWIRKGKIRVSSPLADCGSCGVKGDCTLVLQLPRTYELVRDRQELDSVRQPCKPD